MNSVVWQSMATDATSRAAAKGQRPYVLWLTGLSGAGKTTIATLLDQALTARGKHAYVLDGDNLRHGLNSDLGFTDADRTENIRRTGEVAALFADAGLIVIVSLISPFRADRDAVRQRIGPAFLEIFVDTPLEECRRRDVKGLYAKAGRGTIANFTGVSSVYEPPSRPDLHLHTMNQWPEALVEQILARLVT